MVYTCMCEPQGYQQRLYNSPCTISGLLYMSALYLNQLKYNVQIIESSALSGKEEMVDAAVHRSGFF